MAKPVKLIAFANRVLLSREAYMSAGNKQQQRFMSRVAVAWEEEHANDQKPFEPRPMSVVSRRQKISERHWVPHPRSGIYFPQGQDWVMEDIPDTAACFGTEPGKTYWLRNVDGVEKHDPDLPSADHYLIN